MKYIPIIEFPNLKEALEFNRNSSKKYTRLMKVFKKYYLYSEEYELKDLSYLLNKEDF